jgi:hypothetical protein
MLPMPLAARPFLASRSWKQPNGWNVVARHGHVSVPLMRAAVLSPLRVFLSKVRGGTES